MAAKPVKNLSSFRAIHDKNVVVPNKIRAGIASLEKEHGPEGWEYEMDFIKRCGVSTTDFGAFRDAFDDQVVETTGRNPKKAWFATVRAARATGVSTLRQQRLAEEAAITPKKK